MKPFNLDAALAGARIVTRSGLEIKDICVYKDRNITKYPVYAILDGGCTHSYTVEGFHTTGSNSSSWDLFMLDNELYPDGPDFGKLHDNLKRSSDNLKSMIKDAESILDIIDGTSLTKGDDAKYENRRHANEAMTEQEKYLVIITDKRVDLESHGPFSADELADWLYYQDASFVKVIKI